MDMGHMDMSSMTAVMSMDMSATMSSMASMAQATESMSMDMASMSSAMASMSMNMASTAAAAATGMDMGDGGHHMGGMDHGHGHDHMDMGGSCKISMLWNWNTIDACFISDSWHVTSRGMFAGTCIGVFAWVLALEALRRAHREFDRYVARTSTTETINETCSSAKTGTVSLITRALPPNLWQQAVRSLFYTVEFGSSYLLMLMAMYYNGYILITMWISAFLAYFVLAGDTVGAVEQVKPCC